MPEELSDGVAERMVRRIQPEWTVRENTPITSGTDAVSFLTIETEHGYTEMVLEACTAVPPADFRPEPYLLQALKTETSVPVPDVYGAVNAHPDLPAPYYLMERREGVLADDVEITPAIRERMARDAGRFAGEYHAIGQFDRYGNIRLDDEYSTTSDSLTVGDRTLAVADDAPETWRAFLEELYADWITDLDEEFSDLQADLTAFIDARLSTLNRSFTPVLGHIDYKPWNVLVQPTSGATTAVLDWGHATAMAPYYDLILTEDHLSRWASLDSDRRERVRSALVEGYEETNSLERDSQVTQQRELYLAVSRLQPLVWFSEWNADVSATERERRAAKHREFVADLLASDLEV